MDRTVAIETKSYNPGFLTDDELRKTFSVRVGELESLIDTVRENTGGSNQHVVVVGPRGSGKTTLLLRVSLEIRSDPGLSSRLHPIVFGEESPSVASCGEFWLECLSRLAGQAPSRRRDPDLRRSFEELRRERDERALRERCLGVLLDFAEREAKRLVLFVEDLDVLIPAMMDPDAGWCLRKTLQTEPQIMLIGSATSRFGEIDRPDQALYDLFRVLTLRPLNRNESAALCESVAGRRLPEGEVRRLRILTGGSPRLLATLTRLAAAGSFRTPLSALLDLVDDHTAYFKAHLESLPPQERRVHFALAELWRPSTAREVGERARMETSKCSAQLRRLMGRGLVSEAGGTDRRKLYRVTERLSNVYCLLRRSHGTDSRVEALVRFMDGYYSRDAGRRTVGVVAEPGSAAYAAGDVGEILRTLPELPATRTAAIRTLMAASIALGADRMAAMIRESPSADLLLPLTTALDLEMGKAPRVAVEVLEVAGDVGRELGEIREWGSGEQGVS